MAIGLFAGLFLYAYLGSQHIDERTSEWVVSKLSETFQSRVELQNIHVNIGPRMVVSGNRLVLYYHNRTDVPPLIRIEHFSFNLGLFGILRVPRHINGVYLENMTITVPPRQRQTGVPPEPPSNGAPLRLLIDKIVCNKTELHVLSNTPGKDPLDFAIHDLVLKSVGPHKRFDFHGNLTNAEPKGEIATTGAFGPWDADEPGDTRVSGTYSFTNADLGSFHGIGGTLSSEGSYQGQLNRLDVTGETDTPNFSLDPIGQSVPLHTEFSATVDSTDGDTHLHSVRAILVDSVIIANGSIIRSSGKGHVIALQIVAPKARLQDLLRLATKSNQPMMTGIIDFKAHMLLPPGNQKVMERISLQGEFGVNDAEFASTDAREKLESLSRHALGEPRNEDAGSAVTDLSGQFVFGHNLADFKELEFSVPGIDLRLNGTYDFTDEALNLRGHLRMKAKLSHTVTGKKWFFLKLVDPFFKRHGAGSVVPIRVTGTRDNPKFALALFH
jgi:AsmA-like C-terminal region